MHTDDSRANETPDRQDAPTNDHTLEDVLAELRELRAQNDRLTTRVTDLERHVEKLENERDQLTERLERHESTLDDQGSTIETHDSTLERHDTSLETLETTTNELENTTNELEATTTDVEALAEATRNRTGANKTRIEELQARELEKGAHLRDSNVDEHDLDLDADYLERLTKSDGHSYYRLPDSDDPLDRTDTTLAHGDLLPIQQLARLDEDMRRSTTNALPTRLAAKLWQVRTDSTVGDDPWETGCKDVRAYVTAGDLKHWIRRQEDGISDAYAKKLVSRMIDALLELSKNRLAVHRKTQRKNGLSYTERRLVLPTDADVPGTDTSRTTGTDSSRITDSSRTTDDTTATTDSPPETADVHGQG